MDLKGKVAIVTGSSSGIGASTALAIARRGGSVVVNCSRSRDAADAVAAECRALGGDAIVVAANVADDADCRALADAAMKRWGRIDWLVNNAGTTRFVQIRNLSGISAEDFQAIYAVNVIGAFQMVRACETALRAARGAVVNVSSIASQDGLGSSIGYASSKGALNTLTIGLAKALGPDVRVNAVLPGFIEGGWLQAGFGSTYETVRDTYKSQAALEEVMTPDDIAHTIVWLLDSPKTTGQLLRVDAGKGLGRLPTTLKPA
ncbi:MAG TPA: SDR family oxidoreductase [Quisquiliibacterium sp.]|nr:SDR family oxidoreductase [Quisquiliibacterium sp.]